MGEPLSNSPQYYLGIGGTQSGPFTEQHIIAGIQKGEIPSDALVWFSGLEEWKPITDLPHFQEAFLRTSSDNESLSLENVNESINTKSDSTMPKKNTTGTVNEHERITPDSSFLIHYASTFSNKDSPSKPLFHEDDGVFARPFFVRKRIQVMIISLFTLIGLFVGMFYWWASLWTPVEEVSNVAIIGKTGKATREARGRKALSELLVNPKTSVPTLVEIIKENSSDSIGNEVLTTLLEFYRTNKNPAEAGRLLFEIKRPYEASRLFLTDPDLARDADVAIREAASIEGNVAKKVELLLEDIPLLLGPLNNYNQAIEQLREIEKLAPNKSHAFRYYLKKPEEKIANLFSRLSFYFVQNLIEHIESEFAQLSLASRPWVELKREKTGLYRIVGAYKGDIFLRRDRLKDIRFVWWLREDKWVLVETNFTKERQQTSKENRDKNAYHALSTARTLTYLELLFRAHFPKNAVHENIAFEQRAKKPFLED